jgi:hypothetical protein
MLGQEPVGGELEQAAQWLASRALASLALASLALAYQPW